MEDPDFASVAQRYEAKVRDGGIERDRAQEEVAAALDRVLEAIRGRRMSSKSSALGWLFAKKRGVHAKDRIRGLYIHGAVGRGKTMLMDIFYRAVPAKRKRRVHFHDFMADVHGRIHAHREALKEGTVKEDDPIPPVAKALFEEAWVLCFDEFTVTDIADAMILSRLFTQLFERGAVLVATSNVEPDELYRDGLNRQLFLPFVDLLKSHVEIVSLDARTDYRLQTLAHRGREITVPKAAGGAARFSFDELCGQPLGASDYAAIAGRYDTLFVEGVPVMAKSRRNEAKRFIMLIDTLYDLKRRIVVSAEAEPDALYPHKTGTEGFEFERTASRLMEMQSADYLRRAAA